MEEIHSAEYERLRRAIERHRREVQCCQECGDALVADARAKRKASPDARLWAALNDDCRFETHHWTDIGVCSRCDAYIDG